MSLRCRIKGHEWGPWTPYERITMLMGLYETARRRVETRWCNRCTAEQERAG